MVAAASCLHVTIDGADEVLDRAFVVVGHQLMASGIEPAPSGQLLEPAVVLGAGAVLLGGSLADGIE